MTAYWEIRPEWPRATVFIVGGGPSLSGADLDILKGQKVIAINTSFQKVPFADFMIFSDFQWWDYYRDKIDSFTGRIVCASRSPMDPRLLMVRRKVPPGLDQPNDCLPIQFTTTTGAMGLAVKLGAKKLVLLGIDGRTMTDDKGNEKTHHHKHSFGTFDNWRARHRGDLQKMVEPLKERGIEVVLATPSDYEDLWPRAELSSLLARKEDEAEKADPHQGPVGTGRQHLRETVRQETDGGLGSLSGDAVAGDLPGSADQVRSDIAKAANSDEEHCASAERTLDEAS